MVSSMRERLAQTATDLLERDDRVAILLAVISQDYFRRAMRSAPTRTVSVGIMEPTLIGVAAGFAMEGFHPIVHSIAPFLVERPLEQLKLDFGYQHLGGTFMSVGASYDYAAEGGTHQAPGDVGAVLTIPGAEVLAPGTPDEAERLLRSTYHDGRITYIRGSVAENPESFDVAPGVLHVVRRGRSATVIAFGPALAATLDACEGLDVTVAYTPSVEPFDYGGLAAIAGDEPFVITVEPWYEGTAMRSVIDALRHVPARYASIGVPRRFLHEYGTAAQHDRANGLDAPGIRRRLQDLLADR
jgi:transketolase